VDHLKYKLLLSELTRIHEEILSTGAGREMFTDAVRGQVDRVNADHSMLTVITAVKDANLVLASARVAAEAAAKKS
jgi:hypothetical protein